MQGHSIEGSVVLVTGANRGIGLALVRALLRRGAARVYAGARKADSLAGLVAEGAGRVVPLKLDVTRDDDVAAAAKAAADVNMLINNAGVAAIGQPLAPDTLAHARTEFEVNVFGVIRMVQAFLPTLRSHRGTIVNLNSVVSLNNFPFAWTYSASKAASHSLTQGLRAMLAGDGVRVIGVHPGPVDTDMAEDVPMDKADPADVAERILDAIEAGDAYNFPDTFAVDLGRKFFADPLALENELAAQAAQA